MTRYLIERYGPAGLGREPRRLGSATRSEIDFATAVRRAKQVTLLEHETSGATGFRLSDDTGRSLTWFLTPKDVYGP